MRCTRCGWPDMVAVLSGHVKNGLLQLDAAIYNLRVNDRECKQRADQIELFGSGVCARSTMC